MKLYMNDDGTRHAWYDPTLRSWIMQYRDEYGNQIGECEYSVSRSSAKRFLKGEQVENPAAAESPTPRDTRPSHLARTGQKPILIGVDESEHDTIRRASEAAGESMKGFAKSATIERAKRILAKIAKKESESD